jgi:hypothetical protein
MAKLDRLGWAAGLNVVAYGVRLGIRTNDPAILSRVVPLLPPGWKRTSNPRVDRLLSLTVGGRDARRSIRRFHLLYSDALPLARTHELDELLEHLRDHLQLYVAEASPRRVFVHAGVVGWRGRALLLPGQSHAGKSTLVEALVKLGASYYSDEYAVLDERGRVHPFVRALQSRTAEGTRSLEPATLGWPLGVRPLRVGLVATLEYAPGARWRPRWLTAGRGLLELLRHTVPARVRPGDSLTALRSVVSTAPVIKGRREEAPAAAETLLRTLDWMEAPR